MESLILIAIVFYDKFLFFVSLSVCLTSFSPFSLSFSYLVSTELILLFVVVKSYIVVTNLELANAEFITPGEFSL